MNITNEILRIFGEIMAYGGGGAAVAYFLFQFFGKNWIENKFAQNLEQHKHAQAIELQRLRVEIDSMLNGAIKIQEKEYEVLPEAWRLLNEAFSLLSNLVAPFQQYPDLDRMNPEQLNEFLDGSELRESQNKEIRASGKKVDKYQELITWHRVNIVKSACIAFNDYIAKNGIFLPPELKQQFDAAKNELWSALIDKEVGHGAKDWKMQYEGWTAIKEKINPLYKSIETGIYARLQAHGRNN